LRLGTAQHRPSITVFPNLLIVTTTARRCLSRASTARSRAQMWSASSGAVGDGGHTCCPYALDAVSFRL